MFGTFQQSNLRIEIAAPVQVLRDSLLQPAKLQQWLFPQQLSIGLPEKLSTGLTFTTWIGIIPIHHLVEQVGENSLILVLSQGIDGFHEWRWGEGWVQSWLEGISVLPLGLGQTNGLIRLRQFLATSNPQSDRVSMRL